MHTDRSWQDIGWNGIQLQVPETWQPAVIQSNYLLFENRYQPVFEIKWQKIHGRFSADRIMKKVQRARAETILHSGNLPLRWQRLVRGYQWQGFRWQHASGGGRGILLFCPVCRQATLLHFHRAEATDDRDCTHLLRTLRDHTENRDQTWAIFDIRARLPTRTRLLSQQFQPGHYTIRFQLDRLFFSLLRFMPAAELLRQQTLSEFGSCYAGKACLQQDDDALCSCWRSNPGPARRLLLTMQRKKAYQLLYLWHIPKKNVILGIDIKSRRQIPILLADALKNAYSVL